jgi:hypothetical protein
MALGAFPQVLRESASTPRAFFFRRHDSASGNPAIIAGPDAPVNDSCQIMQIP